MKIDQIPIDNPCCESWNEMDGDDARRHCARCDKDVVNLSMLTKREAHTVLAERPPCVRYRFDQAGNVVFAHPQVRRQRRGLERLLGAAALVAPLFLAGVGCSDEPPPAFDGTERAVAVEPATGREVAPARVAEAGSEGDLPAGARAPSSPPKHQPPLTDGEKTLIEMLGDRGWTQGEPSLDLVQDSGEHDTGQLSFQEGVEKRILRASEVGVQGRVSTYDDHVLEAMKWPDGTTSWGME